MAIRHVAGPDDVGPAAIGDYGHLPDGPADNMALWAPWVRASLFLTEALRRLKWEKSAATVSSSGTRTMRW